MPEFERIIAGLPPEIASILREMARNGPSLAGVLFSSRMAALLTLSAAYNQAVQQAVYEALLWLASRGVFTKEAVWAAMQQWRAAILAAEAAEGAAGAGTVTAGETAVTGLVAAKLAAILAAMLALYIAYDSIRSELETEVETAPTGRPCSGSGPTTTVFALYRRGIGTRTSYNRALAAAMAAARTVMTCGGGCASDRSCTPVAIPITIVPRYRILWTTTTITYMVGCACL